MMLHPGVGKSPVRRLRVSRIRVDGRLAFVIALNFAMNLPSDRRWHEINCGEGRPRTTGIKSISKPGDWQIEGFPLGPCGAPPDLRGEAQARKALEPRAALHRKRIN